VFVMPSEDYSRMTDDDLAQLVAYVRALPPKDAAAAPLFRLPLIVRLVHGAGVLRDAAEKIDHRLPPSAPVAEAVTVEHGRYVAQTCMGCHGASFDGGRIAGAPPHWPPAARLHGAEGAWARYNNAEHLKRVLRTGIRPDGSQADPAMPRNTFLTDTDVEAMYLYFRSLDTGP
jgi:mono/diheme cytochrome c family protein